MYTDTNKKKIKNDLAINKLYNVIYACRYCLLLPLFSIIKKVFFSVH